MAIYKATIRIPTEQYAYIEIETEGSSEQIAETYDEFNHLIRSGNGVETKIFNKFIENQLYGKGNDVEEYNAMNSHQKMVVQEVKKAIKRIEAKK